MTNSTEILAHILDCGIADAEMLNDMEADVFDIIDQVKESWYELNLENIFLVAFDKAKDQLEEKARERIPGVKSLLEDYIAFNDDGEKDLPGELYEVVEKFGYGYIDTDDYPGLARRDLKALEGISIDDCQMYFNYLDSHIYFDNEDVWFRFFKDELDELESYMGLSISNR